VKVQEEARTWFDWFWYCRDWECAWWQLFWATFQRRNFQWNHQENFARVWFGIIFNFYVVR
jgi:hypothetical protein